MNPDYLYYLPIGIAFIEGSGQLIEYNQKFVKLIKIAGTNVKSGDTYESILEAILHVSDHRPDQQAPFVRQRIAAFRTGETDTYQIDSRSEWALRFHCEVRDDKSGILSITDISEFVHKEALFKDAELMSRSGVWELDLVSGQIFCSDSVWAVFGPGSQEAMGDLSRWAEFVHPDDRERFVDAVTKSITTLQPYELKYRVYRSDGELMHISAKGKIVFDKNGSPRWGRGVFQDITQISQAEEALQRSEKYFRSLIENALDIITVLDGDGIIRFESPSLERVLGYKPEELIGRKFFAFVHPDDLPDVMKTFTERSRIAGPAPPIGIRFQHKDGSWRILEAIGSNLLDDPVMAGLVVNSRDITERKQLEEQFRQAQRMEAIGHLTAGIAHDFNNLLTAINGFARLMQFKLSSDDPHQESLDRILHSGQRAADLVRQLLVFSRKQIIEPQVLNLNSTVNEMDKMLRRIIGEDIRLKINITSDLWNIKLDQSQMEQVIVNLAVNARDAMPEGGQLTIETANVLLDTDYVKHHLEAQVGEHVLLAIRDTGLGMSEEIKVHIFEPFFTTKERGKGTGLGLATVYGIVKQNGGHIRVSSELGIGTTFKVYLPSTEEESPSPTHIESGAEMSSGNETILLIEDDTEVRNLVQNVLQNQGYTLLVAEQSQEALELATHHRGPIHLLLTDVIMPGMSGKLLAEELVQSRSDLKILFMSGYTDNAIAHHGVLDPGVFLLQKPFGLIALTRKVRQVLDS